jgi:NAD(P)H dehydrogenase (quinone)
VRRVEETLSITALEKMNAPPKPNYPIFDPKDTVNYDAFLFGIPTRYGSMPAQWKVRIYDYEGVPVSPLVNSPGVLG